MAKKDLNEDVQGLEMPVHYIKQPYPLTTLRGDLTMSQTKILVEMMDVLSDKVGKLLRNRTADMKLFSQDDLDKDGNICIDIPLQNIANRKDEYRDIDKVAPLLVSAQMKIEKSDEDGDYTEYFNAFTSIRVPKAQSGRRQGFVRVIFSQYQANTLFDFSRFSPYIKAIAKDSKSVYTSRLYMLLSAEKFRGAWTVEYQELRNILGCNIYDDKTKTWNAVKYEVYKNFKYKVLRTAEAELKKCADEGKADCYFTYKEIFETGKGNLRTNPDKIEFTIFSTKVGDAENARKKKAKRYIDLEHFMVENFEMKASDAQQILDLVDDDIFEQFEIRVREIYDSITKQGNRIKSIKRYAIKSLTEALKEFTQEAQVVEEPIVDEVVKPKGEVSTLSKKEIDDFNNLKMEKAESDWVTAFNLVSITDECVTVSMPRKVNHAFYVNELNGQFLNVLEKEYDRRVVVIYTEE